MPNLRVSYKKKHHPVQINYLTAAGFAVKVLRFKTISCRELYPASILKGENIFKTCEAMFLKTADFITKKIPEIKSSIFRIWNRPNLFT